ncbi:MAG: pyrroline-5-carboxylate reductase [Phaeodactylibacter sp.]|nr:pyrroline-5-carboxylate reductase [Phaeodactylibacter sp.]MCB9274907.1 pyrroline-5-carboxylate reductase [Lewinellaceae bacterium]
MKILIIGGGNMGLTYAQSFQRSHITSKEDMMILERSEQKAAELALKDIGTVYSRPEDCIESADLAIFAVKPQDSAALFENLKKLVDPQQVFLSIMAGIRIQAITEALGVRKVIRAMPNLPAQIGMGMTAFTSSDDVTRIELVMVQNLLNTTGKTVYVEKEEAIDAATAISGSGPAYVWFFMKSLMDAAREMGFSYSEAELLVSQTFRGAIELFSKSDLSCEQWIDKVCSRGGTTEAALASYRQNLVRDDIMAGAVAALARAVELGTGS